MNERLQGKFEFDVEADDGPFTVRHDGITYSYATKRDAVHVLNVLLLRHGMTDELAVCNGSLVDVYKFCVTCDCYTDWENGLCQSCM